MPIIENGKKDHHLNSVKNAMKILKSFTTEEPEKTVKDLSENLGISKSAVSRLLSTMASEGLITKIGGTHRFRLGTSVLSLSGVLTSTLEIHQEATPVLKKLVEDTGETAHLSFLENYHTVYLHKIECSHPVQTLSYIGKLNPLHCTSSGKVLAANMSEDFINRLIERGLKPYGPNCITSPSTLLQELKKIRVRGYAIDIEEFLPGVSSISAPIRCHNGKVIAAVNNVGPIQRVNRETIPTIVKQVVNAGNEISKRMGYMKL